MAPENVRELFPVTFFHGEGPVVLDGADIKPELSFAGIPHEESAVSADNPDSESEGSEDSETTTKKVEKPRAPAPD